MRVTVMFLLHFLLIKRNYFIFYLCNFLVDTDQNATFPLLNYIILMQFSNNEIGNFPDNFKSFNKLSSFDTLILATFMTMFFIKWCHFHTERGKFPDAFMTWMKYAIFIRWIFCIFQVPNEKTDSTNQRGMLFLARSNKNKKVAKNQFTQKFHNSHDIWFLQQLQQPSSLTSK